MISQRNRLVREKTRFFSNLFVFYCIVDKSNHNTILDAIGLTDIHGPQQCFYRSH